MRYERNRCDCDCTCDSKPVPDCADAVDVEIFREIAVLLDIVTTLKEMYRISSSRLEKAMCEIKALKDDLEFYEDSQKVRFINECTRCA